MRLLLIDTCGDVGSLALAEHGNVLRERMLAPRTASAHLVSAIRDELGALGWSLHTLAAVGVVNGPGSFTGVRVGMAAAKGLCEVAGVRLVALSRLELLLSASDSGAGDLAVLDAGRGEFYVRARAGGEELLVSREELLERAAGGRLLVTEEKLLASLAANGPVLRELSASAALSLAETRLKLGGGGDPVEAADANYVRQARGLYVSAQGATSKLEPR